MEAEIFDSELLHKLKARVHLCLCVLHSAGSCSERLIRRADAEHIRAARTQVMPPRHGKRQMLAHFFAEYHSVGVIKFKRERV